MSGWGIVDARARQERDDSNEGNGDGEGVGDESNGGDDDFMETYRQMRLQQMREAAQRNSQAKRPDLVSGVDFLTTVVCHVFGEQNGLTQNIDIALGKLSDTHPFSAAQFVRLKASDAFGMIDTNQLPALLYYKDGQCVASRMRANEAADADAAEEMLLSLGFEDT